MSGPQMDRDMVQALLRSALDNQPKPKLTLKVVLARMAWSAFGIASVIGMVFLTAWVVSVPATSVAAWWAVAWIGSTAIDRAER